MPDDVDATPGLGEPEAIPGGATTGTGNAVPDMPPGSDMDDVGVPSQEESGGGLTADDLAQPTTAADPTGDRATGLTGLRD
jgi:hypothetical protein